MFFRYSRRWCLMKPKGRFGRYLFDRFRTSRHLAGSFEQVQTARETHAAQVLWSGYCPFLVARAAVSLKPPNVSHGTEHTYSYKKFCLENSMQKVSPVYRINTMFSRFEYNKVCAKQWQGYFRRIDIIFLQHIQPEVSSNGLNSIIT